MCAQANLKVTIQFHQAVGVGVEGQTARRENGSGWWENSICGAATQRYSLRLMMGDWEAVHRKHHKSFHVLQLLLLIFFPGIHLDGYEPNGAAWKPSI